VNLIKNYAYLKPRGILVLSTTWMWRELTFVFWQ